jgi:hypothetical protein
MQIRDVVFFYTKISNTAAEPKKISNTAAGPRNRIDIRDILSVFGKYYW